MSDRKSALAAQRWDQEYRGGKYDGDEAVAFVGEILSRLEASALTGGEGLYVGCGNGRNYIPLIDAGLNLTFAGCLKPGRNSEAGCLR